MRGDGMRRMEWRKDMCGINLVIEHRVGHAPEDCKRVGVIQYTLVFQKSLQLGNHRQKMCLNSGLKFLSTSRLSKLSSAEDDVSLDFLEKKNKDFPSGKVWNMEKNWWVRLVEDNFQWSKFNPRNEISRVSRERKSEHPPSQSPNLCRIVFTIIEEVLHGFCSITSEASAFCSHAWLEGFVLGPDSAIEDLESSLFCLGQEQGQRQYFISIEKGVPSR
jgi:hypothetical protein